MGSLLQKASALAYKAHLGQVDKGGHPYIMHPIAVASNSLLETSEEKVVGWLHDVLEDTDITLKELQDVFPPTVTDALVLLNHDKAVPYMDYIQTIIDSKNIIAIKVKMADLENNMQLNRIPNPTDRDFERVEKYKRAYNMLEQVKISL